MSNIEYLLSIEHDNPKFPKGYLKNTLEPIIMELQWLTENDIVFEPTTEEEFHEQAISKYFSRVTSRYSVEEVVKLSQKLIETGEIDVRNIEIKADIIDLIRAQDAIILRLMALMMETTKGVTAVTALPFREFIRELPNSKKSGVAQIVINNLPLPNNETPWEKIIDYRNDSKTQKHLLSLRRWISRISKQSLSPLEIEEEIESLINDFQGNYSVENEANAG